MSHPSRKVAFQHFFALHITRPGPHAAVYRLTGGRIGWRVPSIPPVLLLTTRGRKSGRLRSTPVTYWRDGERLVVAGTNSGRDQHPDWYWNLKADPRATVQLGPTSQSVEGREVTCEERARLWALIIEDHPLMAEHQRHTARQVPVFTLSPLT